MHSLQPRTLRKKASALSSSGEASTLNDSSCDLPVKKDGSIAPTTPLGDISNELSVPLDKVHISRPSARRSTSLTSGSESAASTEVQHSSNSVHLPLWASDIRETQFADPDMQEGEGTQEILTTRDSMGLSIKPLPNGMSSLPTPFGAESKARSQCETPSEPDTATDDYRFSQSSAIMTPKVGGFGVRNDHVPHVEGMRSIATDRAQEHEHRTRHRSKSDSEGTKAEKDKQRSKRHSSRSLIGKQRDQLHQAKEWGANFWCIITDPKTQSSFFANPQTGECRWQVPTGTIVLPPNPDGEWWELYDGEKKLPYYYHTQTAKSVWVRPNGFVIPLTAIQESTLGRRFSRTEFGEDQLASMALAEGTPKREKKPAPPAQSPSIDQVLAGKARTRIMGNDRELVAQALATKPLLKPLNIKLNRKQGLAEAAAGKSNTGATVSFDPNTLSSRRRKLEKPKLWSSPRSPTRGIRQSAFESYSNFPSIREPYSPTELRGPIRRERDPAKRLSPLTNLQQPRHIKRLSTGDHFCMPTELQSDIRQFAVRNFTTHRVGPFRRKLPLEKMLHWQKNAINAPLLNLEFKELQKDAIKIFKIIQRIMGDRDAPVHARPPASLQLSYGTKVVEDRAMPLSPRAPGMTTNGLPMLSPSMPDRNAGAGETRGPSILEEERWVLERGIASRVLRDEIYAQLLKQLSGNPNGASVFRGWQFLCVAVVTFPPSNELHSYLSTFIETANTHQDQAVALMAKHCVGRLRLILRRGARQKPPTIAEIQSASDAAFNPSVFGHTLDTVMETQKAAYPEMKVPIVLVFLCNALLAMDAVNTEGIFRVAGDADLVTELKVRIERGHYRLDGIMGIDGADGDVAVLSSVLKLWLRELEEPLIPPNLYNRCISISEQPSLCISLVRRLPMHNRRVLLYTISFLQLFLSHVEKTKMPLESLALIFAPNFFRCESDRLSVVFNNTKYEQHFVASLLRYLKVEEVEKDFVPRHGQGQSPLRSEFEYRPNGPLETVTDVSVSEDDVFR